uniref:Signal transduction histidine kinase with CheB and CheR activity n=1 Tax=Solibacter usitatus (strain Ellin6076) TaxID=234267 RepID=Q01WE0_SOLUE
MDRHPDRESGAGASSQPTESDDHLIAVGVGASAGGLEALTDLVSHLSPHTGMAFIFVQHLDPHHESALPELLAPRTRMPVVQVHGETRLRADHIYVIPPNNLMLVRGRKLMLEPRPAPPEKFRPIDDLFHSLAQEFQFNAVGIVLSGTATDGTLGLKAIKAEGGITFAQNETAKFDSMPRSAISTGVVDFVMPPAKIGEELGALARRTLNLKAAEMDPTADGSTLHRLVSLLRNQTGVDFGQYKQATILRRLNRRMVMRRSENLDQYLVLLKQEPEEARALFADLLINVTDFFRDPDVFEAAKRLAFPQLVRLGLGPRTIRAWIPGCSSGEEVYSIAIAMVEFLEREDLEYSVQIFGTDVSENVIAKARAGIYDQSSLLNVSAERLRRFFVRTETGYQITRAIRDMCVFSRHNIAKDPPLSRMNLISCRNLLIYFAPALQRRVIGTFVYALHPGGVLILGSSETLGSLAEMFSTIDEGNRIYSRRSNLPRNAFDMYETHGEFKPRLLLPEAPQPAAAGVIGRIPREVNRIVLSRYGPCGVVVNEALKITEYRGEVAQYLGDANAALDADLMQTVRPELRGALSVALEQARRTNVAVAAEALNGTDSPAVALTVVPLLLAGMAPHFLILFGERRDEVDVNGVKMAETGDNQAVSESGKVEDSAQLRQELKATREYLQSVIEELRSTNEEAQSANEELQSTNEELQTAKEELQSSNEELNTINAEMQSRNSDLARTNDDLINLLSSMNVPIVMTGNDLRIRRFTPMAEKVFRLIPTDIGRPIADLKPHINVPNLDQVLQQVIDTLQPHEQDVQDVEGRHYLMRVRPYRTFDNRIDGSVLQLLDVSELRRNLEEIRSARDFAEAIVNTVRAPLVVLDEDLTIQDANRAFYETFAVHPSVVLKQPIYQAAGGRFDLPEVHKSLEAVDGRATELHDIELACRQENGETRALLLNIRRLRTPEKKHLVLMGFEDITERKRAAEARYRRLFESARDGILLVETATGEILDVNPYTERLLGYSKRELVGRKLWEIEPTANVPTVRALLERVRDQGALRMNDLPLLTKDGREIQTEVIANTYTEGERRAIQFNIRDVSERKKFERELQQTQRLEGLGLLAGGIAHDFNNLLTGILGNASLAYSETAADQGVRMRLREIVQAAESAAFLTRQMLAYAGRGRFVIEQLDLGELVKDISALMRTSIPRTVELKLDLAPSLPAIDADPAQIQQVVMNLVINGAEAIGEDEIGRVTVKTSLREVTEGEVNELIFGGQAGSYVQLEVTDTGSGMDEAVKARAFDPFFTTKFTGRGLGLAAVQGIVKGHGGNIAVYSTPGHGTTFVVLFPGSRKARKAPAAADKEVGVIPPGTVALVIDDEEAIRTLADSVLKRESVRVMTAADGKTGVELFREHSRVISVVVLDLMMPVMGGGEALAQIKQIDPKVPVILTSGYDESETARRYAGLNPQGFLQKPYTAERLVEAVAAAMQQREK